MSLSYHSELLARHYADKPESLSDIASLCEHLVGEIKLQSQAREALEWIALRLPVRGALAQQNDCPELALECSERIANIVQDLSRRVDLYGGIVDPVVKAGFDDTDANLGQVLVALGHRVPMDVYTPDNDQIPALARTAASQGNFVRAAELISVAGEDIRDEVAYSAWESVARLRSNSTLEGLSALPDPDPKWWVAVQRNDLTVSGNKIAQRVLLDRPHLLCDYVEGVILQGEPRNLHPQMLSQAAQQRSQWTSEEGWQGSALAVMMSRAGDEEIPFSGRIRQITQDVPSLVAAPNEGPLSTDFLIHLAAAAAGGEKEVTPDVEFRALHKKASALKPKAKIDMLLACWGEYPRGRFGAISGGLSELSGRAMVQWGGKSIAPHDFLPLIRQAYSHPSFVRALENGDQDTIEAQARSVRLLLGKVSSIDESALHEMSQQQKNDHLEFQLWHFASERLGRRAKEHKKKNGTDALTPRQVSMAKKIDIFFESGAIPSWGDNARKIGQRLMCAPFVDLPGSTLASLHRCELEMTQGAQSIRKSPRL